MSQWCVLANVPDGWYEGTWSGYTIRYLFNDKEVQCQSVRGVRGINIPVRFQVKDNFLVDESIEVLGNSQLKKEGTA